MFSICWRGSEGVKGFNPSNFPFIEFIFSQTVYFYESTPSPLRNYKYINKYNALEPKGFEVTTFKPLR
ncbi:protein of unknown function [Magnetospirillum sp. XM-1]|nr:protein of unknown function [Magnetospirillum sp. XM-1]